MSKRNWILLIVLLAANYLILLAQSLVSLYKYAPNVWVILPETRYFLQSLIIFIPLIPLAALKFKQGRKILAVLLTALVVHAVVFLVKAHVPGARRHASIAACNWAVEQIRADYKGPKRDAEPFFVWLEYHPLSRPCVEAHVTRVSYLLGGRGASLDGNGLVDIPDYLVDETKKINPDFFKLAKYEILAEKNFGKRDFVIYKRVK